MKCVWSHIGYAVLVLTVLNVVMQLLQLELMCAEWSEKCMFILHFLGSQTLKWTPKRHHARTLLLKFSRINSQHNWGTYVALLIDNNSRLAAEHYFLGSMNLASSDTFVDAQPFNLSNPSKICWFHFGCFLHRTPMCDWCVVRWRSKNNHQKDTLNSGHNWEDRPMFITEETTNMHIW